MRNLQDGLWAAFRFRGEDSKTSQHDLPAGAIALDVAKLLTGTANNSLPADHPVVREAQRRLQREFARGLKLGTPQSVRVGEMEGVAIHFRVPSGVLVPHAEVNGEPAAKSEALAGIHVTLRTRHGWLDLHTRARADSLADQAADWQRVFNSLQVAELDPSILPSAATTSDQAFVGRWKSHAGLLEFNGEGQVQLAFDRKKGYRLDDAGRLNYAKPVALLQGEFTHEDSTLTMTWADDTQLETRWKIVRGQLLLTDQYGRITRLERIFPNR